MYLLVFVETAFLPSVGSVLGRWSSEGLEGMCVPVPLCKDPKLSAVCTAAQVTHKLDKSHFSYAVKY